MLQQVLDAHDPAPAPAYVVNRTWDLVLANTAAAAAAATSCAHLAGPLHLDLGGRRLRLLSMVATIGAAHDVTVAELRIETLLPADPDTRSTLAALKPA